jgi:hypothetical protein
MTLGFLTPDSCAPAHIEYSQILTSMLVGPALFAKQPSWKFLAGAVIMFGATIYLMRRGG